mmetsp:Transcript_18543/g.34355  ORF Transcript_18543/g.34355 Transcript_18543/m.34355 type:complete len:298 (+) Transcript_18543:181-1074(+)
MATPVSFKVKPDNAKLTFMKDLRTNLHELEADAQKRGMRDVVMDSLKLKATRKRIWWKVRAYAFKKGFPMEVSMEEYNERREKNEAKFNKEYPSILWQEQHRAAILHDAQEKLRKAEHYEKKRNLQIEKNAIKYAKERERRKAFSEAQRKEIDALDVSMLKKRLRDLGRIQRLEDFEKETHERMLQDKKDALEAKRQEEERIRLEQQEADRQQEILALQDKEREQQELTARVDLIMRRSGTLPAESKDKPVTRSSGTVVVRYFAGNDEKVSHYGSVSMALVLLTLQTCPWGVCSSMT